MMATGRLGEMLQQAMQLKARELGVKRYTYRDLERDSGVHFSYGQKAVKYGRRPSRVIIEAWAQALNPYFPEEEALIAAGFMPNQGERGEVINELAKLPLDRLKSLLNAPADAIGRLMGHAEVRESHEPTKDELQDSAARDGDGCKPEDSPPIRPV